MNVFENVNGSSGNLQFGSAWASNDLIAIYNDVLTLKPNTNAYNPEDPYWSNNNDGNKIMEANYYLENPGDNLGWNNKRLTFSGNVDESTLDERYEAIAFIKVLNADDNYAQVNLDTVSITSNGPFSLTLDVPSGNFIGQVGFQMTGLNANPNDDWGNIKISGVSGTVNEVVL